MTNRIMELAFQYAHTSPLADRSLEYKSLHNEVTRVEAELATKDLAIEAMRQAIVRQGAELAECKAELAALEGQQPVATVAALAGRVAIDWGQYTPQDGDKLYVAAQPAPNAPFGSIAMIISDLCESEPPQGSHDAIEITVSSVKVILERHLLREPEFVAGAREAQPLKGADWTITMRRMLVAGKCARRECRCAPENAERCIWWDEPDDAPKPLRAKLATKPMTEAEIKVCVSKQPEPKAVSVWSYTLGVRDAEAHHGTKGARE